MQLFTVAEITEYVKVVLERDPVLSDLWVNGEVSNLFRSATGHAYFTLKEGISATVRCALFRGNHGAELLEDGVEVNVHGRVSFYETRGDLQLYVDMVQPTGLGVLALELERLKARLEEEGLFEPSRKRALPQFPRRIGVATSEQGAVFHDICNVVARRYPLAEIVLCPTSVQGERATPEVVDAIRTLDDQGVVDVIIVARGGGSLEDLWAFNTEAVARAIYACRVPVVSAVGHETDVTIADLVADYRAPTPSAAAEAVTPDTLTLFAAVSSLAQRAASTLSYRFAEHVAAVEALVHRMRGRLPNVAGLRQRVDDYIGQGWQALQAMVRQRQEQSRALEAQLNALSPMAVLGRGYAVLVQKGTRVTVTSAAQVGQGDVIEATVKDGRFDTKVQRTDATPVSGSRESREAIEPASEG
jgi:exodeoxyribonuclease VII large subunit